MKKSTFNDMFCAEEATVEKPSLIQKAMKDSKRIRGHVHHEFVDKENSIFVSSRNPVWDYLVQKAQNSE